MKRSALLSFALLCTALFSFSQTTFKKSYSGIVSPASLLYISNLEVLPDGYAFAGAYNGDGYCLVRTDLFGNIAWAKEVSGPDGLTIFNMAATSDGGFMIVGNVDNCVGQLCGEDGYFAKFDGNGNLLYDRGFGGTGQSEALYSAVNSPGGGHLLCGAEGSNTWLVRVDTAGYSTWSPHIFGHFNRTQRAGFSHSGWRLCHLRSLHHLFRGWKR